MLKSALKIRKIPILSSSTASQVKASLDLQDTVTGIVKTSYHRQNNSILFEYDLLKITYSNIEDILIEQKMCQSTGIRKKLLTIWLDYLDTTARDNALAPPAACCNKPPKRAK